MATKGFREESSFQMLLSYMLKGYTNVSVHLNTGKCNIYNLLSSHIRSFVVLVKMIGSTNRKYYTR